MGGHMLSQTMFLLHLILGYAAWLIVIAVYVLPRLAFNITGAIDIVVDYYSRLQGCRASIVGRVGCSLSDRHPLMYRC